MHMPACGRCQSEALFAVLACTPEQTFLICLTFQCFDTPTQSILLLKRLFGIPT